MVTSPDSWNPSGKGSVSTVDGLTRMGFLRWLLHGL